MTIQETITRLQNLVNAGINPNTPLCVAHSEFDDEHGEMRVVGFNEIAHIEDTVMVGTYGKDQSRQMMRPRATSGEFVVIAANGEDPCDYWNEQAQKGLLEKKRFDASGFKKCPST